MDFVHRVLWILRALWIVLSETVNILLRNLLFFFGGGGQEFYHSYGYLHNSF